MILTFDFEVQLNRSHSQRHAEAMAPHWALNRTIEFVWLCGCVLMTLGHGGSSEHIRTHINKYWYEHVCSEACESDIDMIMFAVQRVSVLRVRFVLVNCWNEAPVLRIQNVVFVLRSEAQTMW